MKKKLLAGLLAASAVAGLASCSEVPTVSKLEVSGHDTEVTVGETYDKSTVVVNATMADGTTTNVTTSATVDASKVDTTKAGVYAVVVSYEGQSVVYYVTVSAPVVTPEATVSSIVVSGQNSTFTVGDTFEKGAVKVTATMSDETTKDVTADATVDTSKVDTTKAGVYAVLVSYEGAVTTYFVTVNAPEAPVNVATLKDLEVNATDVKTQYVIGDEVSLENLVVYETYSNTIGEDTIAQFTDLTGYTVKVTDEDSQEVTEFEAFGTYTVTVAKGELSDSFTVRVGAVVYDSVEEALDAALNNTDKVNGGSMIIDTDFEYTLIDYVFGENHFEYSSNDLSGYYTNQYYFEVLDNENVFGVQISNYENEYAGESYSELLMVDAPREGDVAGVNLDSFFGYAYEINGPEDLVSILYSAATDESVTNYKESFSEYCAVCGAYHAYNFSFSTYMEYTYYAVEVTFSIDSNEEFMNSVKVVANAYSDEDLTYDEENDLYTLNEGAVPSFNKVLTINQTAGERTAANAYPYEAFLYKSFDLTDGLNKVAEDTVINAAPSQPVLLAIENGLPETASASIDTVTVTAVEENEGSYYGYYDSWEECVRFTAYDEGTYAVTVKTANVTKTFTVKVAYPELTSFQAAIYDQNYELVAQEEVTVEAETEFEIAVLVNDYANDEFTASLPENTTGATVENLYGSWYFNAAEVGTYVVTLTSVYDSTKTATLTVVVEPKPTATEYVAKVDYEHPMWGLQEDVECNLTLKSNGKGSYVLPNSEGTFEYVDSGRMLEISNVVCTYGEEVTFMAMKMGDQIYMTVKDAAGDEVIFGEILFTFPPIQLEVGNNEVKGYGSGFQYEFTNYSYEPTTYTFTITNGVTVDEEWNELTTVTVTLEFYETYTLTVYGSETIVINVTKGTEGSGSEGEEETTNELVLGENTVECTSMGVEVTFTATEAGTYEVLASPMDAYLLNGTSPANRIEFTLEAGESYTFTVGDNGNNDGAAAILIQAVSAE